MTMFESEKEIKKLSSLIELYESMFRVISTLFITLLLFVVLSWIL